MIGTWTPHSNEVQWSYSTRTTCVYARPRFCVASRIIIHWLFSGTVAHLGRMIFSLGCSEAKSLKVLNLTEGGWRKGLAPKLNSHCWYDIKLAAAKKPDLRGKNGPFEGQQDELWKTWEKTEYTNISTTGTRNARLHLRGRGEDLFFWWQLMSVQIEDHLLLAEIQEEADSIPWTGHKHNRSQSWPAITPVIYFSEWW